MNSIRENIQNIRKTLSPEICLVAVSKTKPDNLLMKAYKADHRVFGENKVQELVCKYERLPKDIQWHMIGHLQRNKVKYIAPFIALIHGVDSQRLLKEINKRAAQNDRSIDVLLQIHIAKEESKFGFDQEEVNQLLTSEAFLSMKNVNVRGLMGMATFTENNDTITTEFKDLKSLFDTMKQTYFKQSSDFDILSMGMTNDYKIAQACGSNMLRIGSAIFGPRN